MGAAVILNVGDTVLGHYKVKGGTIGIGGEGAGYRGEDTHTGQPVFIKQYHDLSQATTEASSFLTALRRLRDRIRQAGLHEIASGMIECGTSGGDVVAIFPFFQGTRLADKIGTKLDTSEIRGLVIAVTGAVYAIHHADIWHLDLHPANVIVRDNVALIDLDAGAVDHVRFRRSHVKTICYSSPESWHGDQLDEKSDVFSLGCILYALLFGQPPFPDSEHYGHDICRGRFSVPGSQYNPQIVNAVLSCLHPVPGERFEAGLLLSCLKSCSLQTAQGDVGRPCPAVRGLYRSVNIIAQKTPDAEDPGNASVARTPERVASTGAPSQLPKEADLVKPSRLSDWEMLEMEKRVAAARRRTETAEKQLWAVAMTRGKQFGERNRSDQRARTQANAAQSSLLAALRKADKLPLVISLVFVVVSLGAAWVFYLERTAATKTANTISSLIQKIDDRRGGECRSDACLALPDYPEELIYATSHVLKMRALDPLSELGHELGLGGRNELREDVLGPFVSSKLRERISAVKAVALLLRNKSYVGGCIGAACASRKILNKELSKLDITERYVLATMTSVSFPLSEQEEDDILHTVLTPFTNEHPNLGSRLSTVVSLVPWK